jgi:hypothetical protein
VFTIAIQSLHHQGLSSQFWARLAHITSSFNHWLTQLDRVLGVGVGDASASPTAAILLSVLQDSMGRIATILFAHKLGTALEPECKMYRLAADIFNDAAMILDCVSPAFPKWSRVLLLSFSSALRALCGVAGSSSKASLSAHFATQGNLAELNAVRLASLCWCPFIIRDCIIFTSEHPVGHILISLSNQYQKDSSQETIISLLGMLAGSLVVSHATSRFATWSTLLFLISIHLWTNYKAVCAVRMRTLNRQRANIVFSSYLQSLHDGESYAVRRKFWPKTGQRAERDDMKYELPSPKEVSLKERIFELDGVMRWHGTAVMGHCALGVPLRDILNNLLLSARHSTTGSYSSIGSGSKDKDSAKKADRDKRIEALLEAFEDENYILSYFVDKSRYSKARRPSFLIVLKETSGTITQVKSWFHAFLCARKLYTAPELLQQPMLDLLEETLEEMQDCWPQIEKSLAEAGWDLHKGALETRSGVRVSVKSEVKRRR